MLSVEILNLELLNIRNNQFSQPENEIINSFTSLDSLLPEFLKENKSPPAQKDLFPEPVRIIAFIFNHIKKPNFINHALKF